MCKSKLLIILRHKFRHEALGSCLKGHFNIKSQTSYLRKDIGQKCSVHTAANFSQRHANICLKATGTFPAEVAPLD